MTWKYLRFNACDILIVFALVPFAGLHSGSSLAAEKGRRWALLSEMLESFGKIKVTIFQYGRVYMLWLNIVHFLFSLGWSLRTSAVTSQTWWCVGWQKNPSSGHRLTGRRCAVRGLGPTHLGSHFLPHRLVVWTSRTRGLQQGPSGPNKGQLKD